MGVGAEQSGDAAVGVAGQGSLLRCGLGVEVHDAEFARILQQVVQHLKGGGQRLHIHRTLQVDHRHLIAAAIHRGHTPTGGAGRQVGGAKKVLVLLQQIQNLVTAEGMITAGDDVGTGIKDMFGGDGGDAVAVGAVFAIDDAHVHAQLPFDTGQMGL